MRGANDSRSSVWKPCGGLCPARMSGENVQTPCLPRLPLYKIITGILINTATPISQSKHASIKQNWHTQDDNVPKLYTITIIHMLKISFNIR